MMKKTFKQIRDEFWETLPPELNSQRRSRKTQNDYCTDIRVRFCDYIDQQRRAGEITEKQSMNITL